MKNSKIGQLWSPEKSTRFPEKSTQFPEKSILPPEKSTWFPEKSNLPTKKSTRFPEKSTLPPKKSTCFPDQMIMFTEISMNLSYVINSISLGSPFKFHWLLFVWFVEYLSITDLFPNSVLL